MEFEEAKYEELVGKYIEYREKEKLNKDLKDIVASEIDAMLHLDKIDYKKIFVTACDKYYECKYVDRNTKKVDYVHLAEVLSDELYNEIITENTSTYLKIGAEAKKKEKKSRPVVEKIEAKPSNIPKAKILK